MSAYQNEEEVIVGFTIINGAADFGGGIKCMYASPTIMTCITKGNSAEAGDGIYCYPKAHPSITDCIISDNWALNGGGIDFSFSYAYITKNVISGNYADYNGGGINCFDSTPSITGSVDGRASG